jgi:hypothetical protein
MEISAGEEISPEKKFQRRRLGDPIVRATAA